MKYFVNEETRKASGSTCYFEFQNGKFKNKFWLKDSLCLHADVFDELMLYRLFSSSIEDFDYYGVNEVSEEQWNIILKNAKEDEQWESVIEELRPWAEECFKKHKYFTICGI